MTSIPSRALDRGLRTLLFVPGNRRDMIAKAARVRPDAIVVDLEDAVPPERKTVAREALADGVTSLAGERPLVLARVNAVGTPWCADDLFAVAESSVDGVVLPKFEEPEHLELIADSGCGHLPVIVGIESVRGVADVARLAAAGVHGVYFGAEDFVADLGGVRTVEGAEVLYARSRVAIAAHVNDIAAIDQAFLQVRDNDGLLIDAQAGRRLGYSGKICVHPDQLPVVHEAFVPSERAVAHARAVVAAYATGSAAGNGVILLDGRMIDRVHLRDAEQTLRRAERMS